MHNHIVLIPGLERHPTLRESYLREMRAARLRCGGTCDDGKIMRKFAELLAERDRTLAQGNRRR